MRKFDLKNYTVKILNPDGTFKEISYKFKDAIVNLMFHPNLRLSGKALLETNIIAEKIMKADKEVLLEEEEYNKVKSAVDGFEGYSRNEVKLVDRVLNCPQIDVKESK